MSFYFREKPRFGDKPRGKPRDELLQELKQQFDDSSKSFFEPAATRLSRDPFERHTAFSRGFPFDDVDGGFGRRSSDIRSHLDDLASRHPEFADHLLGPAWGDIPAFHTGSLRNRRRGSGSSSSHQGHPDDDARSQASGSSGTSAASGASGVSSQGEPRHRPTATPTSTNYPGKNYQQDETTTRRNPIPQYGLRNTVDIGQHRHNMENPEKSGARGQRSMSAPPENRQQDENPSAQESSQNTQNPNQRFVSRVDITPQFVQQPQQPQQAPQAQPEKTTKPASQQGNVRHIPIFVEGRDEPVIPKNVDQVDHEPSSAWTYKNSAPQAPFHQPPQFQSPPQFHRPSHFNQHYGRARDWLPDFEEEFYGPQATFQQPQPRRTQQHHHQQFPSQSPPKPSSFRQQQQQPQPESRRQEHPFYSQQTHNQHQQPQQQQQQPQPQEPPAEPRKQTQPKDPLEKVAEVQKEVDALTEQVNQWSGTSRKDKQYMYLDEMLTRELIKLDDIETEGKENVRQARKNAIKSIQNSISLLESKAPLPEQLQEQQQQQQQQQQPMETATAEVTNENPEAAELKEDQQVEAESAIPLPAAPASPTKEQQQQQTATENSSAELQPLPETQSQEEDKKNAEAAAPEQQSNEQQVAMEASVEKVASAGSMEVQPTPVTQEAATTESATKMETENPGKSPKAVKKVKKTKKQPPQQQQQQQTPVCDDAIPLPAPETQQAETK